MNAYKIEYKSLLTGNWVASYHPPFSTEKRALNTAAKDLNSYETRVVPA